MGVQKRDRKEYFSKYHKEWYQRKKAGLPTRMTPILSEEQKRKLLRERGTRYKRRRREYVQTIYGETCAICGEKRIMIIHRKDGTKHKLFNDMSFRQIKAEIEQHKDEYVRVCGICHTGIHWAMKYLGLKWENIPSRK